MYVTLNHAKKHLNIDESFKDDDSYIISLILAAEKAVERHIDNELSNFVDDKIGELEQALKAAILLLVGQLYANREPVSYTSAIEVPISYNYLLDLYKNYSNSNLK